MPVNTAVLFIIFNRPETTSLVFEKIREAKPTKLYIAADGPRTTDEALLTEAARKQTENIDWPCNVLRNYSAHNKGCKHGVVFAINWAFEQEDALIILEDDCLPDVTFFTFCEVLLKRHYHQHSIMHIGSNNFQGGILRGNGDYYFSKYAHIWGWATWKRAWIKYDIKMEDWPRYSSRILAEYCNGKSEKKYWKEIFQSSYLQATSTWDYQWLYAIWKSKGMSIIPNNNLVHNIGFNANGTHSSETRNGMLTPPLFPLNTYEEPDNLQISIDADKLTVEIVYAFSKEKLASRLLRKYVAKARKILLKKN